MICTFGLLSCAVISLVVSDRTRSGELERHGWKFVVFGVKRAQLSPIRYTIMVDIDVLAAEYRRAKRPKSSLSRSAAINDHFLRWIDARIAEDLCNLLFGNKILRVRIEQHLSGIAYVDGTWEMALLVLGAAHTSQTMAPRFIASTQMQINNGCRMTAQRRKYNRTLRTVAKLFIMYLLISLEQGKQAKPNVLVSGGPLLALNVVRCFRPVRST